MAIELSGVRSEMIRVISKSGERARSSIWNDKHDFRSKLHDPKFNCHFIRSILKSHNLTPCELRLSIYLFFVYILLHGKAYVP